MLRRPTLLRIQGIDRVMRVYLRKRGQAVYLSAAGDWVGDRGKAMDLDSVKRACEYARQQKWDGIEVVLSDDDPLRDLVLPVG